MTPRLARLMSLARGLLLLLVAATTVVLVVDAMQPAGGERGRHSVVLVVGVVGTIALVQLLGALLARHRTIWRAVTPLWAPPARTDRRRALPAVVELEALIISASTGGVRARDRLDRRLSAMGCATLAESFTPDETTPSEPTSSEIIEAVTRIVDQRQAELSMPVAPDRAPSNSPAARTEGHHAH